MGTGTTDADATDADATDAGATEIRTDIGGLLIGSDPAAAARADLLRRRDPDAAEIADLLAGGYLIRPEEVSWLAPTGAGATEFLSRLGARDRRNVRTAQRSLAESGARTAVEAVGAELLDDFLVLYGRALSAMPNGIPVAVRQRDDLLAGAAGYFAVTVRVAGRLVAACLVLGETGRDLARIRFSAAEERLRGASITRVIYLEAVDEARRRGFGRVSLGSDPNLYGHIVRPGLFSFKCRFGFEPRPAQAVLDAGHDIAERILRLDRLSDPTLVLAYARGARGVDRAARLRTHLFTRHAAPDLRSYRTPFAEGPQVHLMD